MKTLYVTDLDGTLLNNDAKLSEYSVNTINYLIEKGMYFTYATARALPSAANVTKGLKINIPVITRNGIFIEDTNNDKKLYSLKFSDEERNLIIHILEKYSIYPLVCSFINGEEKRSIIKDKSNSLKADSRYRLVDNIKDLYYGDLFYIRCVGKKDSLINVYHNFMETNKFNCLLQKEYYSEDYWCEILPKNATKGNTILVLKEILKCNKLISFGDGINDIEMFKASDECYAVENAEEELKRNATGIIMSNDNNGVAKWLIDN
jgi:Cof subfamily protein (haloacid dehalogenase superfamily)